MGYWWGVTRTSFRHTTKVWPSTADGSETKIQNGSTLPNHNLLPFAIFLAAINTHLCAQQAQDDIALHFTSAPYFATPLPLALGDALSLTSTAGSRSAPSLLSTACILVTRFGSQCVPRLAVLSRSWGSKAPNAASIANFFLSGHRNRNGIKLALKRPSRKKTSGTDALFPCFQPIIRLPVSAFQISCRQVGTGHVIFTRDAVSRSLSNTMN